MPPSNKSEEEIREWCLSYIKDNLDIGDVTVGPDISFPEMGLDSAASAYFVVELEEWLGTELYPEITAEHPTITQLAKFIANPEGIGNAKPG